MSGRYVPIDEAFQAVMARQESLFDRPLPYTMAPGNPFGDGHHDCPVDGCDVWRTTRYSLDSHVESEHGRRAPRPRRTSGRPKETPEARAERLERASQRMKALIAERRQMREMAS